jgi:hypothetical protein
VCSVLEQKMSCDCWGENGQYGIADRIEDSLFQRPNHGCSEEDYGTSIPFEYTLTNHCAEEFESKLLRYRDPSSIPGSIFDGGDLC